MNLIGWAMTFAKPGLLLVDHAVMIEVVKANIRSDQMVPAAQKSGTLRSEPRKMLKQC